MNIDQLLMSGALSLLAAMVPASAQIYTFDPPGSVGTSSYSINASGASTGYYVDATGGYHGFVRDPSGNITSFDPPGSTATQAFSINQSGVITGCYTDATNNCHGFVRDPAGNLISFDAGPNGTIPSSINASGAITGSYGDATGEHGFVRDASGNITSFDPPGYSNTRPYSINASGAITGSYGGPNPRGPDGFVRDPAGNFASFDPPGSTGTSVFSINARGAVTGSYRDTAGMSHGFAGTVPNGMDISKYVTQQCANPPCSTQIPASTWQAAKSAGVSFVVVQAWGGMSENDLANAQLLAAQAAGMATGAYVLLSYYASKSAELQVKHAFAAIGPNAIANLKIIFIDVEPIKDEVFSGTGQNVVDTTERIGYINSAVSYIQTYYTNLKIGIYSSNGKKDQSWTTITGNCGIETPACVGLMALPFWDVEHKIFIDESGATFCGNGVAGLSSVNPLNMAPGGNPPSISTTRVILTLPTFQRLISSAIKPPVVCSNVSVLIAPRPRGGSPPSARPTAS